MVNEGESSKPQVIISTLGAPERVLSVNVSVFTLSAIAMDRYRAVLYPLSARTSKRKATLVVLAIWTMGIIIALPTELDFRVITKTDKGTPKPFCQNIGLSDTFRKYYMLALVIIQYFLPLLIITAAYVRMSHRLWGATAPGNAEDTRDAAILRNKKKVIKMLVVVVLLFAICWLPFQMYNLLQNFIEAINQYQYINVIWFSVHWLAMSSSGCNFFIYAIYNDKFQREFRTRLHCLRICYKQQSDSPCSEVFEVDHNRSENRASCRLHEGRSIRNGGTRNPPNRSRRNTYRSNSRFKEDDDLASNISEVESLTNRYPLVTKEINDTERKGRARFGAQETDASRNLTVL